MPEPDDAAATIGLPPTDSLALLGTWGEFSEARVEHVQNSIRSNGSWASDWSFPVRKDYRPLLQPPFWLYLNVGQGKIAYRFLVVDYRTSSGNQGIETPWPEITDVAKRDKTKHGESTADIFKTWFRIGAIEALDPPLGTTDFEPAKGWKATAMLKQSSFGYGYRTGHVSEMEDRPSAINLILYGPPGTGKTYWMQEKQRQYTDQPTTLDKGAWLQQVVAEHGWRNVLAAALAASGKPTPVNTLREHPWVRAKIQERNLRPESRQSTLWNYLQSHTPEDHPEVKTAYRRPPFIFWKEPSGAWRLQPSWQEEDPESLALFEMLSAGPAAIGPGPGDREVRRYRVVTFHPSFTYEDFVRGIRPVASDDGHAAFKLVDGVFKRICDEAFAHPELRYALFIDEINRANIAKVFGELITLIEPDKRIRAGSDGRQVPGVGMTVQLPGSTSEEASERPFGVPENLDIYGTMNTADRSIALLDIALRRRFQFRELAPAYTGERMDRAVEGVHLGRLLRRINDRLEFLLDRDHRIGHAYLMHAQSLEELRHRFQDQIIPLLQEYFFDDFGRVAQVLATSGPPFLRQSKLTFGDLFPKGSGEPLEDRPRFEVASPTSWTAETFRGVYSGSGPDPAAGPAEPEVDTTAEGLEA